MDLGDDGPNRDTKGVYAMNISSVMGFFLLFSILFLLWIANDVAEEMIEEKRGG